MLGNWSFGDYFKVWIIQFLLLILFLERNLQLGMGIVDS
jgi:alanyl-tRNA synthetase